MFRTAPPCPGIAKFRTVPVLALAASAALAHAQRSAEALHTRGLAATCAGCHGTDGRGADDRTVAPGMVPLAGMSAEHIATQVRAFRDGTRPATVMHQLSKGFSDAQIDRIAAYFAAQPSK